MKRTRRLLYQTGSGVWTLLLAIAAVLLGTGPVAFGARSALTDGQSTSREQRQMTHTEMAVYNRWLHEEVVYIITDKEHTAFQKLTSDEERDMFIEQFWERRNPNPGSPKNDFKQEYYRRIAYANEHYPTASGRPGWRTDRGRIYITYGPPDEIDAYPAKKPYALEKWKYRHVTSIGDDVLFTFVDRTGNRSYDLVPRAHS
jgi:GWxTD domain-containing protein